MTKVESAILGKKQCTCKIPLQQAGFSITAIRAISIFRISRYVLVQRAHYIKKCLLYKVKRKQTKTRISKTSLWFSPLQRRIK
jgi:hypothetical protein